LCEEGHFGEAVRLLVGAAGEPDPGPAAQAVRLLTSLLSHHMAATQQAAALVAAHVIPALRLAAQVLSYFFLFQMVLWIRIRIGAATVRPDESGYNHFFYKAVGNN
jgi:hypothetical protein